MREYQDCYDDRDFSDYDYIEEVDLSYTSECDAPDFECWEGFSDVEADEAIGYLYRRSKKENDMRWYADINIHNFLRCYDEEFRQELNAKYNKTVVEPWHAKRPTEQYIEEIIGF